MTQPTSRGPSPERHPDDLGPPDIHAPRRSRISGGIMWAGILAVVVVAVMLWVAFDGSEADNPDRLGSGNPGGATSATVKVNEPLPTVALTRLDGEPLALSDYQGKPMVVNFWASWCPPCISEMPAFEEVFQGRGGEVAFVGINVRESPEVAGDMADRTGVTYDLALDPNGSASRTFNVVNMPTTVFVTADGIVASAHAGALTSTELDARIDALLAVSGPTGNNDTGPPADP